MSLARLCAVYKVNDSDVSDILFSIMRGTQMETIASDVFGGRLGLQAVTNLAKAACSEELEQNLYELYPDLDPKLVKKRIPKKPGKRRAKRAMVEEGYEVDEMGSESDEDSIAGYGDSMNGMSLTAVLF